MLIKWLYLYFAWVYKQWGYKANQQEGDIVYPVAASASVGVASTAVGTTITVQEHTGTGFHFINSLAVTTNYAFRWIAICW